MIEVSWAAIGGVCAIIMAVLTIAGFLMAFSKRMTTTETSAQAASILATALGLKVDTLQKELSDYKVEAAKFFVSDKELHQAEDRFRSLVEEIKRDIRGVTDRLDRVLEAQGEHGRT
jgi:hypothetical protein